MNNKNCEIFKEFYYHLFERINFEYQEETGKNIKPYKDYEPDLLITFCKSFEDKKGIHDQLTRMLSGLIILQALPNANHRTAFRFIDLYFGFACNGKIKTYIKAKDLYDDFYSKSKPIIDFEINHEALFNKNYMDSHHSMGIENHIKHSRELLDKIAETQSGMIEAVPFQRFITSLYHSGSSLNQTGIS